MGNLLLPPLGPQSSHVYILLPVNKRPPRIPNPNHDWLCFNHRLFCCCTDESAAELSSFQPLVANISRPWNALPCCHLAWLDMDMPFLQPDHRPLPNYDTHANALEGCYALAPEGRPHHTLQLWIVRYHCCYPSCSPSCSCKFPQPPAMQYTSNSSKNPINGAQLAASWAVRETFVAIMTTNIPMLFPTFKKWAVPIVERASTSFSPWSSPQGTLRDSRFSGAFSMDAWRRKHRSTSRILSMGLMSPTRDGQERNTDSVGLSFIMLDPAVKKPEASKPPHKTSAVHFSDIETSAQPERNHANGRLSTRSDTSMISWSETLINSPQSDGTEHLLGRVHHDGYSKNV